MLFGKKLKLIKKPNLEKEKELRDQIEREGGLEKKDMPAMIIAAMITILPVAVLALGLLVLVAYLFVA